VDGKVIVEYWMGKPFGHIGWECECGILVGKVIVAYLMGRSSYGIFDGKVSVAYMI
jgi:hypothetical protein